MSSYTTNYADMIKIEEAKYDVMLEHTEASNLFSRLSQANKINDLYRHYYYKSSIFSDNDNRKILIVPKKGYLINRLVYLNTNLTGGTIAGSQAINIIEQDGNIRLRNKGAVNSCPLIRFLRSLFYAFGIEVDESKVDIVALCNAVLHDFEFIYNRYNGESILIDSVNIEYIEVCYIIYNGITYFDEELVQSFANVMYEAGWFSTNYEYISDVSDFPLQENIDYGILETRFSKSMLTYAINESYKYGGSGVEVDLRNHINDIYNLILSKMPTELLYGNYPCTIIVTPNTSSTQANVEIVIPYTTTQNVIFTSQTMDSHGNMSVIGYAPNTTNIDSIFPNKKTSVGIIVSKGETEDNVYIGSTSTNSNFVFAGYRNDITNNYNEGSLFISNVGSVLNVVAGVEGIKIIDGSKIPTNKNSLITDYPTWYEKLESWVCTKVSSEGEILKNVFNVVNFVPLTLLAGNQEQAQSGEVTNPDIVGTTNDIVIKYLSPLPTDDEPQTAPDENNDVPTNPIVPPPISGETPVVPPITPTPSITSGKLFTVYNPTTTDIDNLGGFLWGETIAGILAELFSNPMEAIISLSVIYATPSIGARKKIVLGYTSSESVTAPIVTSQYIEIDCGTVPVPEYYGNVTDYSPYASASIFLPFIGFREININEIMGSNVNVNYKVDVYTGTVYASISIEKEGKLQVLYTYEGNCAVQIPLTGGDKTRLLTGLVGGVAGIVMGNPAVAIGSLTGGMINGVTSNKQGNIGSNAGAMGIKKPYIIITNSQSYDAYNYNKQYGFPANVTIQLRNCKGFTRVKSVHVDSISNATNEEKQLIETILKQGVVIS